MNTRQSHDILTLSYARIAQEFHYDEGGYCGSGFIGLTNKIANGDKVTKEQAYDVVMAWAWSLTAYEITPPTTRVCHVGLSAGKFDEVCKFLHYANNVLAHQKAYVEQDYIDHIDRLTPKAISYKILNRKYKQLMSKGVQLKLPIALTG